jgi:hypothetical protein
MRVASCGAAGLGLVLICIFVMAAHPVAEIAIRAGFVTAFRCQIQQHLGAEQPFVAATTVQGRARRAALISSSSRVSSFSRASRARRAASHSVEETTA